MLYTNAIEPLLCITLSISVGILLGSAYMIYKNNQELKDLNYELDKFRKLYFDLIKKMINKGK